MKKIQVVTVILIVALLAMVLIPGLVAADEPSLQKSTPTVTPTGKPLQPTPKPQLKQPTPVPTKPLSTLPTPVPTKSPTGT